MALKKEIIRQNILTLHNRENIAITATRKYGFVSYAPHNYGLYFRDGDTFKLIGPETRSLPINGYSTLHVKEVTLEEAAVFIKLMIQHGEL
jgi:hypothetical protein